MVVSPEARAVCNKNVMWNASLCIYNRLAGGATKLPLAVGKQRARAHSFSDFSNVGVHLALELSGDVLGPPGHAYTLMREEKDHPQHSWNAPGPY